MKRPRPPIVTLTTDFGSVDSYVAEIKGMLLMGCPELCIIDISHEVPEFDVETAGYLLARAAPRFPPGTVHIGVVDPGVGGTRRGLIVQTARASFVGPDNGIFAPFLDNAQAYAIEIERLGASGIAPTFHGRDVFAPVAARLAGGDAPSALAHPVADAVRGEPYGCDGRIIHVDRFGNCVTSWRSSHLGEATPCVEVAGHWISRFVTTYSDAPHGQPFLVIDSAGHIEIALRESSAAEHLGISRGTPVRLRTRKETS